MDEGPVNIYNSSPLREDEAFNMVIKNLMALSSEAPESIGEINSYGPIPTPRKPYQTIAFYVWLKAQETKDPRMGTYGRISVFWVISRSPAIMKYTGVLKRIIRRAINFYGIKQDTDLRKKDVLDKIDQRLKGVETGVDSYFITETQAIEPFHELVLVPPTSPILLLDNTRRIAQILLREDTSPVKKVHYRQQVEQFLKENIKGSIYSVDFVTEPFRIELQLSRLGFISETDIGNQFRIKVVDKLTFEDLDEFFEAHCAPLRQDLVRRIVKAVNNETPLDLKEVSEKIGFLFMTVERIIQDAINKGLIQEAKIKGTMLVPSKE